MRLVGSARRGGLHPKKMRICLVQTQKAMRHNLVGIARGWHRSKSWFLLIQKLGAFTATSCIYLRNPLAGKSLTKAKMQ